MVERMSYFPTIIGMNPKPFIDMATLMKLEWVIKISHEMNQAAAGRMCGIECLFQERNIEPFSMNA